MNINNIDIKSYIEQITGEPVYLESIDNTNLNGLSLHLKTAFVYRKVRLLDKLFVFISPVDDIILKPGQAEKNIKAISVRLNIPVALALNRLPSYQRSRYIQRRIPFVVPGKQLYIPNLLLDLRSQSKNKKLARPYLRPATQCMILFHLLVDRLEGSHQDRIAQQLGYSDMTISRAVEACRNKHLIQKGKGPIKFTLKPRDLWKQSLPFLQSPIRKKVYTNRVDLMSRQLITGLNALAHYTLIAGEQANTYAMSSGDYKKMIKEFPKEFNEDYGEITIEVWNYDPQLLTDIDVIDPLSLYLSMKGDDIDERITLSLEKLLRMVND